MNKLRAFITFLFPSSKSAEDSLAAKVHSLTGHYPGKTALYRRALTHRSVASCKSDSNERLELLGDAVLDLIVTDYLFREFPEKDEGKLTKVRTKLVNRQYLNDKAISIGLNEMVEATPNAHASSNSIYGDALEALVGALYHEKGLPACKSFVFSKIMKPGETLHQMLHQVTDFKSRVMEWAQQNKLPLEFKVEKIKKDKRNTFNAVLFIDGISKSQSTDLSKKKAEQGAAQKFWEEINKEH